MSLAAAAANEISRDAAGAPVWSEHCDFSEQMALKVFLWGRHASLDSSRCAAHHRVAMHGISGPSHQQQSLKCSYPLKLAVKKIQQLKCDWQVQLLFRFFLSFFHGLVCHMSYMRKDLGNVPQLGASDWPNTYQWILSDSAQPWAEGNSWVGETPGSFDLLPSVCSIYQQTINPATFSILLLCAMIFFVFPLFTSTHTKKSLIPYKKKKKVHHGTSFKRGCSAMNCNLWSALVCTCSWFTSAPNCSAICFVCFTSL